jgi:AcrR family transcriptional regulator
MVPRSRPEKKRGSSKQIVSAALRVFSEKGFAGGKVDEIARLAGLNKVTLYYHVGNKGALYQAAFQEAEKRLIAAMNQVQDDGSFRSRSPSGWFLKMRTSGSLMKMLKAARLGIAVMEGEGAAGPAVAASDVLVRNIGEALGILLNPLRLIASLRI